MMEFVGIGAPGAGRNPEDRIALEIAPQSLRTMHPGLVAILVFLGHCQQVKVRTQPVGRQGLVAILLRKIAARPCNQGFWRGSAKKAHIFFLTC
jgi:hypothetical protein